MSIVASKLAAQPDRAREVFIEREMRYAGARIRGDAGQDRRRRRPAGRVPGHRAAPAPPADAVLDLPPAHAARSGHGHPPPRPVAVLDVLLHLAVPPERTPLLADQDGRLLPAARGRDHPLGRGRLAARHPHRLPAGADLRPAAHRRRPDLALAGARPCGSYLADVLGPALLAGAGLGLSFGGPVVLAEKPRDIPLSCA